MFQNLLNKLIKYPYILISTIIGIANWQLVFCQKALQWDMINFWLPWRHYIAECYTNGFVPLWNPYSQAGYPLHGDLQGPAYSLETIISSFIFPINTYFLNYLFVAYLILGAIGLFKLYQFFISKFSETVIINATQNSITIGGIIAAVSYVLCGYVTWHGHYFYMIISVCVIPWIYYYAFKIFSGGTWVDALKLSFFVWWQLTAGNPSYLIVSFYFLVFVFIIRFIRNMRKKLMSENKTMIIHFCIAGAVSVILCLPIFLNAYHVFPLTSRAGGIGVEWAAEESLRFNDIFSVFNSFMGYERDFKAGAEQPIYNLYISLFTAFFALIAFMKIRNFWTRIMLFLSILSFLLSIGLATPVYAVFHKFLPFFNVFRMPNLIIIYLYMFLAIMGGIGFLFVYQEKKHQKHFIYFSLLTISVSTFALIYFKFFYTESRADFVIDNTSIKSFLWSQPQFIKSILAIVFLIFILLIGYFLILKNKIKHLVLLIVADLIFNYQIGAIARVYSDVSASYSNSFSTGLNKGFAPPDLIPDNLVGCVVNRMNAFWMNAATFIQQPIHLNDNNFELTNYMKLLNEHSNELNHFIKQPYAFFADTIVPHANFSETNAKVVATIDSVDFKKLSSIQLQPSSTNKIDIDKFEPHHFCFKIKTNGNAAFCLQQNYTPLWKIKLNGKIVEPTIAYYSFPLIMLDKGEHTVEFEYSEPYYNLIFLVSLLIGLLIIILVVVKANYSTRWKAIGVLLLLSLFAYCFYSFVSGKNKLATTTIASTYNQFTKSVSKYSDALLVVNSRDEELKKLGSNLFKYNFMFNEDLSAMLEKIRTSEKQCLCYLNYKGLHTIEIEKLIQYYYGEKIETINSPYGFINVYRKTTTKEPALYSTELNFNEENSEWYQADSAGNKMLITKTGNEFAGTGEFTLKGINGNPGDLVYIECDLKTETNNIPGLCLSIDRNGETKKFYSYSNLRRTGEKHKFALYSRIPEYIYDTDIIKLFFWNNTEIPAYIDNVKVIAISMK